MLPNTADLVESMRRLEVGQQELAVKLESKVDALASVIESDSPSAATWSSVNGKAYESLADSHIHSFLKRGAGWS